MTYIVDIILVGLLAISVFLGFKRGFVKSVLKSGRFFLAVILTIALTNPVAALLNEKVINPPIYSAVNDKLTALADKAEGSVDELFDSVPGFLKSHLEDDAAEGVGDNLDELVEEWSETISSGISGAVSKVLAVILLFVVLMLLLTIVIKLLSGLVKAGPLAKVDRILGLVLGLFVGVAIMLLAARVVAPILTALGQGELVDASFILKLLG